MLTIRVTGRQIVGWIDHRMSKEDKSGSWQFLRAYFADNPSRPYDLSLSDYGILYSGDVQPDPEPEHEAPVTLPNPLTDKDLGTEAAAEEPKVDEVKPADGASPEAVTIVDVPTN